jgi:POT family proton-dependent oligopeptide transporter
MAVETPFFIYLGLTLLVFGSGFFKPNMTSIISEMYKGKDEKKDGAYTIFYMGVNAGAFLGILLCGYLGEQVGWRWGFGLAGIFMLFGLLQFWFAQNIFGDIGTKPVKGDSAALELSADEPKLNPFTSLQLGLIAIAGVLGISWIFNDPISKISEGAYNLFDFNMLGMEGSNVAILTALGLFVLLLVIRIPKYDRITRDRMLAVMFFAFITIFFWAIFEQAPSSLTIFARDYTQRVLEGNSAFIFKIANTLMTIIPLGIITWVLWLLFKKTFSKYALSNIPLGRIATQSDIATAITFLSSDASSMITGSSLIIDGGWTAK